MNHRSYFSESDSIETSYDPHGGFGLLIANELVDPAPNPLEALCELEDWLLQHHGLTFMQAVRLGIEKYRPH